MQKLFEVAVKPDTIRKRAERIRTNVHTVSTPGNNKEIEEIKEIKREPAKDGTMRGGPREGAGRPPKFKAVEPRGVEK